MTLSTPSQRESKLLYDLKMRKSKKGQLKMKQSETSTQYINPTKPTDPPPMKNSCMGDSDCPGNYLCIKPINQELKSRNLRPIPGFVYLKPTLSTVYLIYHYYFSKCTKKQLDEETTPSFTEYGMNYTFMDDDETHSSESTEDCITKYSTIIDKIVNNTDLKKSHIELFKAWTGCHKEFLSKHDKDCFDALESSIPHCEKSAIQMTSDIMGEHPQTNHTISSIRKMSRSLVSNLIPTQKQFKRSTEVSTIATEENLPTFHPTYEQSQNSADEMTTQYVSRVVKYNKKFYAYYLTWELQKFARNLIPMMAFLGQTKAGQKIADRLAGLAVLSCR